MAAAAEKQQQQGFRPLDEASLVAYIRATPALAASLGGRLDAPHRQGGRRRQPQLRLHRPLRSRLRRRQAGGMVMPSWFDIHDTPITCKSVKGEEDVLRAVESVHAMIDREIESAGTSPEDVFVFGLSQGGALAIASVLLYPRTLGGCAVFSGFLPLDDASFAARVTPQANKTPVLWVHGRADSLVPFQAGQDGIKFLRGLGITCQFKAYEGLGHELAPYELEHCQRWAESVSSERGGRRLDRVGGGGVTRRTNKCCVLFNFLSRRR